MLLLDEPTAGVHPSMIGELESQLTTLRDEGMTMVMVEHELGIVERLCKVVVVMSHGKVIAQGPLAAVRAEAQRRIQELERQLARIQAGSVPAEEALKQIKGEGQ